MKQQLFKEDVIGKMSILDIYHYYFPDMGEEDIEYHLWEETCYPFSMEHLLKQLYEGYVKSQK